jgi:hypothetical protein
MLSRMEVPRTCGARVRLWRYKLATESILNGKWDASTLREGDEPITEEVLLKSKYNKHVIGGWRYSIE